MLLYINHFSILNTSREELLLYFKHFSTREEILLYIEHFSRVTTSREETILYVKYFSRVTTSWRPRDAIAKRSQITVTLLVMDPHTNFQRLATNSARIGRPRIRTQFDFNVIHVMLHSLKLARVSLHQTAKSTLVTLELTDQRSV